MSKKRSKSVARARQKSAKLKRQRDKLHDEYMQWLDDPNRGVGVRQTGPDTVQMVLGPVDVESDLEATSNDVIDYADAIKRTVELCAQIEGKEVLWIDTKHA